MKTIITLMLCLLSQFAGAQTGLVNKQIQNDSYFPARHRFNAGLLTTYTKGNPPPILLGEVSYGISNKFSVGIVGGTLGTLALFGVKVNAVLFQRGAFRTTFKMMSIYYPERNGTFLFDRTNKHIMPWMLSTGIVDVEWRSQKNIRWSLGMGLTETHCIDGMKKWFSHRSGHEAEEKEGELPFDVLTTLKASVSIPISKKLTFRPEAFANFQKGKLIERGQHKVGFPVIASVCFVYSF